VWHIDKTPVNKEELEGLKRKALDIYSKDLNKRHPDRTAERKPLD